MVSGAHNAKAAQYVLLYPIASGAGQTVQEILHYEPTLVRGAKKERLFLHLLYIQGRQYKIGDTKACFLYKKGLTSAFQKPFVQEVQGNEPYLVLLYKNE